MKRTMKIIGANARVVRKKKRAPKTSAKEWERERQRHDDDGGGYLAIRSRSKNPVKHGYGIFVGSTEIATVKTLTHARTMGQALANATGHAVKIKK